MTAMLAGQQREDDIALAETPRRQDYPVVMPFHGHIPNRHPGESRGPG
jgi:hypothetical protein